MIRTDGVGPSVNVSSSPQPPVVRDDSASRRTLSVATRAIRASSNPIDRGVETAFPIVDFQQAVLRFDFATIKRLLKAAGLSEVDVNFIESRTNMHCGKNRQIDVLLDVLLNIAIQRSFLTYMPGLPNYGARDNKKLDAMAVMATTQFCTKKNRESFDLFCAFLKRYRPTNEETCLRRVYPLVSQDLVLGPRIRRSFPKFDLQVSNQADDESKGEPVASSSGEKSLFPTFEFQMALTNLTSGDLCRILVAHGWNSEELDLTKRHMDLLHSERIDWRRPDVEHVPLECLDDITHSLLMVGIENKECRPSLLRFLHLLPTYSGFNAENFNRYLCKHIEDYLCAEPDDASLFTLFVDIMNRVPLESRNESIRIVMGRLSADKQQELSRIFHL